MVREIDGRQMHAGQIQGFFGPSVPVDNLESQIIMVESLLKSSLVKDFNNLVIVSPDAGGVYRAKSFAEILSTRTSANVGLTMIVKQRVKANEVAKMELVGNVNGQECIIIDDIIDTAVSGIFIYYLIITFRVLCVKQLRF